MRPIRGQHRIGKMLRDGPPPGNRPVKCNNLLPIGRSSSTFVLKTPIPEYAPHVRLLRNRVAARSSNSANGARCERSENQGGTTDRYSQPRRGSFEARRRRVAAKSLRRSRIARKTRRKALKTLNSRPGIFYPMKQWTGPGGFRAYGIRTRSNSQGSRRFRAPVMRTSQAGARSGAARDVLFPAPSKVSEPRKP